MPAPPALLGTSLVSCVELRPSSLEKTRNVPLKVFDSWDLSGLQSGLSAFVCVERTLQFARVVSPSAARGPGDATRVIAREWVCSVYIFSVLKVTRKGCVFAGLFGKLPSVIAPCTASVSENDFPRRLLQPPFCARHVSGVSEALSHARASFFVLGA